jgi:kynurenine formamidase
MFHNPETGKIGGTLDIISFGIHDGTNSHLDALCHYRLDRDGKILVFNGHPQDLDESGCKANAIDRMGPGVFTRGILVDLPLLRGVPYLEPGTPVYVSDLEAWEKFAGVKIGSGDVLLVRTGRWARRAKLGPWNAAREAAGLHASVAPWLKQRDISVLGSDGVNDVQPSGVVGAGEAANRPIHTLVIAVLGRWLTTPISKTWPAKQRPTSDGNFSSPPSSQGFPEGRLLPSTHLPHSSACWSWLALRMSGA